MKRRTATGAGGKISGRQSKKKAGIAPRRPQVYKRSMARRISATLALDRKDAEALARARAAGLSTSDLLRQGLKGYYAPGDRAPLTRLFVSTDPQLGEEGHLFQDLESD